MVQLLKMKNRIDENVQAVSSALQERREAGQGTIEYIGIAVVITVIIAGLVTWFSSTGNNAISTGIQGVIDSIFGKTQ